MEEVVWMDFSNFRTGLGLDYSKPGRVGSIIVTGDFCMLGNPTQNIGRSDDS